MGDQLRNLSVLAYAQGFTLWLYKAPQGDFLPTICAPGYFSAAREMLAPGDMVLVSAHDGGTALVVGHEGRTFPLYQAVR